MILSINGTSHIAFVYASQIVAFPKSGSYNSFNFFVFNFAVEIKVTSSEGIYKVLLIDQVMVCPPACNSTLIVPIPVALTIPPAVTMGLFSSFLKFVNKSLLPVTVVVAPVSSIA